MADAKVSALSTATPVGTDVIYLVDDPGGTPSSKKATVASIISLVPTADLTTAGIVELATGAETNTGTDATRAVTPDGLDDWTGSAQITTVGTLSAGDVDAAVTAASDTAAGKVELATVAETNTGTDATRAVTPDGLDGWTGSAQVVTVGTLSSGSADAIVSASSVTVAGKIEVATAAETDTGTDATRAVSPDGLAGSTIFGTRYMQVVGFDYTTDTATGDGAAYMHVPAGFNGMNLVEVHAEVITAGTTGTTDIQIANVTQAADMLSTKITIDSGETGSDTAAAAAVIDTANDDVATNDVLRVDVDAVSTTAAAGLIVTLGFRLP